MSEQKLEHCCRCDTPTGRAGRSDDSMYTMFGDGPLCEDCYEEPQRYEDHIATLESELTETRAECIEAQATLSRINMLTDVADRSPALHCVAGVRKLLEGGGGDLLPGRIQQLESELAATKRECEGLREYREFVRRNSRGVDTLYNLAARDATEGGGA